MAKCKADKLFLGLLSIMFIFALTTLYYAKEANKSQEKLEIITQCNAISDNFMSLKECMRGSLL
jgi:hypothetical protein